MTKQATFKEAQQLMMMAADAVDMIINGESQGFSRTEGNRFIILAWPIAGESDPDCPINRVSNTADPLILKQACQFAIDRVNQKAN